MILSLFRLGCDRLDAAGNVVDGLADTTVAQALFLGADIPFGISLPDDSGIYTSAAKVFLAEVTDASDVTNSPVTGADVSFLASGTGKLDFDEEAEGEYRLFSQDGLEYTPGELAHVSFSNGTETGEMVVRCPEAPEFETPENPKANEPMHVEITKGEFANVVAAVYDVDHDKLEWDNLPDDFTSATELNPEDADPITFVDIPAEAFKRKSHYIIGVGGLVTGDPDDFSGTNVALSAFAAGRLAIQYVEVASNLR